MKLLMVTHYFGSHKGGIELVADELFRGLAQRKCEVVWAAADVSAPPVEHTCSRPLPLKTWNVVERILGVPFPVPTVGALKRLYSQVHRSDVVLLHDCLYLPNIAALVYARMLGVPVMVVQHIGVVPYRNLLLSAMMKAGNALITRRMLASADQVIFISKNTAHYFASIPFNKPPALVFNGVDAGLFRPIAEGETKTAIRSQFGLPPEGRVALFVGRFVEKKGILILRKMAELRPTWTWVFAGRGPLDPSGWHAANVRVFADLRGASLAALYRASDVFVLPSRGEGFPLVIQEALASGLPVICGTETAEADEDINVFVRGLPVHANDDGRTAREFLFAIDKLLQSSTTGANAPSERHAFAASRYTWCDAIEQYFEMASRLTQKIE